MNGWNDRPPELFSYSKQVQPVFDKKCVSCHDFDENNRSRLVLSGDNNPFFNASYVDLNVKKKITVAGAGPAAILQAYSWGSHASSLTKIIDGKHYDVKLTDEEKRIIYTWMDINAPYYPVYESAYPDNPAGRSPLTDDETKRLKELTGVDFHALNDYRRKMGPQISFERPELSPCLDKIRDNTEKYEEAVALIRLGGERLKIRPNGSLTEDFIPSKKDSERLLRYADQMKDAERFNKARDEAGQEYDLK